MTHSRFLSRTLRAALLLAAACLPAAFAGISPHAPARAAGIQMAADDSPAAAAEREHRWREQRKEKAQERAGDAAKEKAARERRKAGEAARDAEFEARKKALLPPNAADPPPASE
jgi:hypothetical protein